MASQGLSDGIFVGTQKTFDGWLHHLTLIACSLVVGLFALAAMSGTGSASESETSASDITGPSADSGAMSTIASTTQASQTTSAPPTTVATTTTTTPPRRGAAIERRPYSGQTAGHERPATQLEVPDGTPETTTEPVPQTDGTVAEPSPLPEPTPAAEAEPVPTSLPTVTAEPASSVTDTPATDETGDTPVAIDLGDDTPIDAPVPPPSRFVSTSRAAELLQTAGGDDPVASALEILSHSGPLGVHLASDPIVQSRLEAGLTNARLFAAADYADKIIGAVNSALDQIAADNADAGTGLCLVTGPGPSCVQVADLNHTFTATAHRPAVDAVFAAYGSQQTNHLLGSVADLHFTGNFWSLLREAHAVALTAELRNAWINAGASVQPNTIELTAHLVFVSAYLDVAMTERPETFEQLRNTGVGSGVTTTWNQIVDAYVTTDDAAWNVAFLHDTTAVQELTNGNAGTRRAPF